jgi:hypothetical protein
MTERQPVELKKITDNLSETSHNGHFMEIQRRIAEYEYGWFVNSAGVLVGDFISQHDDIVKSDMRFITTDKMEGAERSLSRGTLVASRGFVLPLDMNERGVDTFLESYPRKQHTYRKIGFISINEPGIPIFRPIKTESEGYYESEELGKELAAVGLSNYLNLAEGIHTTSQSPKEMTQAIGRVHKKYKQKEDEQITMVLDRLRNRQ